MKWPTKIWWPNVVTYTALIDDFYKEGKLDDTKKLFREIPNKKMFPGHINAFIDCPCKEGRWQEVTGEGGTI